MNEKIKELMLEATEDMPETYYWPGQYVEKFAELIVRECDTLCQKHANDRDEKMIGIGHDPTEQVVARQLGRKIKEHFGVEE